MKVIQKKQVLILFTCIFGFLFSIKAQELINKKFYSNSVKDSIDIKVWLPKNYISQKSYPVIYEFVYDHSDYIAATLNHVYQCPSTIVVHASFSPGTSYEKPTLSDKGEAYYQFVKEELLPHIEKKYRTLYRTATGLSQGADYVNYILRTNPELFDAYMIFAIESPNYQANFVAYTDKLKQKKDYFIAIANDVERRVKFANELYTNLDKNENLNVIKREYKNADHTYCMLYGLVDGLLFVYKDYVSPRTISEGEKFSQYFFNVINEFDQKYGTARYTQLLIQTFTQLTKESSKEEVRTVLNRLIQDKINISDLDFHNLGKILYDELSFYDLSETSFRESIKRGKSIPVDKRRISLSYSYSMLAKAYYRQQAYDKIFFTLQEGYDFTKAEDLLLRYALYSYHVGEEDDVKKGIDALDKLISLPKGENTSLAPEQIYLAYAQNYWKLKNKKESKKYLKKSLEINPNYESALEFQKTIQ